MTKERIPVIGCGRTDAGVHASRYFAHIEWDAQPDFDVVERINRILPDDIVVFDFIEMPPTAHTQYSATSRSYTYRLHGRPHPFLKDLSTYYPLNELDFEEMQKVVALLPKYEDYRAFCKSPDTYPHTICKVTNAYFEVDDKRKFATFNITSNRFLRGMIRLIMGNMLLVGKGKMSIATFEEHLRLGVAPRFYTAAYPQGLYLSDVVYPYASIQQLPYKSVFP